MQDERAFDNASAQAAQGQISEDGIRQVYIPGVVCEVRALQSTDNSGLEEGARLVVKNIGKPCAGKSQARFGEGGLAMPIRCGYSGTVGRKGRKQISQPKEVIASSLLYPLFLYLVISLSA